MTKVKLAFILGLFALCLADGAAAQDMPTTADVRIADNGGGARIIGTQFRCSVSVISSAAASGVIVTMILPPFTSVVSGICTPKNMVTGAVDCMIGDMAAGQLKTALAIGPLTTPVTDTPSCGVFVSSSTPDTNPMNNFRVYTVPAAQ